ncbi:hypothetical protein KY092_10325 [Natronomonas gomsonensis]|jgi:hypothetical protein|uniref:DUF7475 family protein n=1 Tax=Natronomonas gomsonensis TaxID=1046043 RepID=UPI0020CA9A97|nr:hypothetical protein [Natronomonas gomsonensis]MCY4730949.1 hypothetical protein [Natronomonas gomsonensis]
MAADSFELRDVEWTLPKAALVVLSFVSAAIHLTLATTTGNHIFAVLALGLLAGFVVFFTNFWNPVLYLVGAIYISVMSIVWVLDGAPLLSLGIADKVVQAGLFVLFVYLLFEEVGTTEEVEASEGEG